MNPNPATSEITRHFQAFLAESGLSHISVKNYVSDIRQFLIGNKISSARIITTKHISDYLEIIKATKPEATYRRYLASLRRFVTFLAIEYRLELPEVIGSSGPAVPQPTGKKTHSVSANFRIFLAKENKTPATIKNYLSDLNHFLSWSANHSSVSSRAESRDPSIPVGMTEFLSAKTLKAYFDHLRITQTSTSVINRRESSLRKFIQFCLDGKLIIHNPFEKQLPLPTISIKPIQFSTTNHFRPEQNSPIKFVPYFNLAILVLATTALGIFGYNQLFKNAPVEQAYPTTPVRPSRQLAFQGRLTDTSENPISTPTTVIFRLFNQATGGNSLYQTSACQVAPDQDGVFSAEIGAGSCGPEIGPEIFSENGSLFMEVTVGGQTLTPRQPIATAGYALNSETLQGYPASESATPNTVPVMDNKGQIGLAGSSPAIVASSGNFALKGNALTLTTNVGTDGNITIAPDGRGKININGGVDKGVFLHINDANLTTGTLIEGYVGNNDPRGTLLHLASGTRMVNRLTVSTKGQTDIIAETYKRSAFSINQTGTAPIFTAKYKGVAVAELNRLGNMNLVGGLTLGSPIGTSVLPGQLTLNAYSKGQAALIVNQNDLGGDLFTASSAGITRFVINNDGHVGIGGNPKPPYQLTVNGITATSRLQVADGAIINYVLTSDSQGFATWQPSQGGGGTDDWTLAGTTLYPNSTTYNVLIGETATASAYGKLSVYGDSTSAPAALLQADTSAATLIINNLGAGNLINASASGTNRFTVANNGAITSDAIAVAGGVVYTDSSGTLGTVAGTAGLCLTSGGSGTPVWTTCSVASENFWQRNDGGLAPINISDAVNIGAVATASAFNHFGGTPGENSFVSIGANFGVNTRTPGETLDVAGNATISGNLTFYDGARTIASRLNTTLTIGDNQTGNLIFNHNGLTGFHTTDPLATVDIRSILGTVPVASISGATSMAALVVDNSGVGDIFTASSSGLNRFVITQNGDVGIGTTTPTGKLDITDTSNTNASFTLTNNTATTIGAGTNTLGVVDIQSTSLSTGNLINLEANALSTGKGINLTSTSTALTSGGLMSITASGNPAASWTGALSLVEYTTSIDTDIDGSALKVGITGAGGGEGVALNVTTAQTGTNALALRVNDDGTYTDSTPFVVDINGNVGIGTATPSELLDVVGNATISGNLTFYGGARTIASRLATSLTIGDADSGDLVINAANTKNVGIGTATPNNKLEVLSTTDPQLRVAYDTSNYATLGVSSIGVATLTTTGGVSATLDLQSDGIPNVNLAGGSVATGCTVENTTGNFTCSGNITGSTSGIQGFWQRNDGTLTPTNITDSINVGAVATASAFNHIGGTPEEDSFLSIGADLGVNTRTTLATLDVRANLGTTPVASISGATSMAALVVDNSGIGDIFTASSSGLNRFVITQNGNVGIGTTTPTELLDVVGNATISGNLTFYGGARTIASREAISLTLGDSQTGNLIINNGGRTAFYHTEPLATVDIHSNLGTIPVASISGATSMAALVVDNSGDGDLFTASSSGLNRFVITQAGNVGIGTTTPTELLDVVGNATISGNLTFYGGARTIASRLATTLTVGDSQTGNFIVNPNGRTGFYTTTPLATVDIRDTLDTIPTASISGTSNSYATLIVKNDGTYDVFSASSSAVINGHHTKLTLTNSGNLLPGTHVSGATQGTQDLGAANVNQWSVLHLANSINRGGTPVVNLATQTLGDQGVLTTGWVIEEQASISGTLGTTQLVVPGVTFLGCTLTTCNNAGTAVMVAGNFGDGKIDVGTVDPPYTINGEKYATYLPGMVGQNEEVAGNLATSELVENIGYRQVIDFTNLPKASNLWLFAKVTDLKKHILDMAVILTPGSGARAWYELNPEKMTLAIYTSKPTTVSYRFTAPRFDSDQWLNTRPDNSLRGFLINDPDQPLNSLNNGELVALDPVFTAQNINQYELAIGDNVITEIGSYAKLLVANLSVGFIRAEKLVSPIADIESLTVNTLSAEEASISGLIADTATVSGTLFAVNIESPVIDEINAKYASASAILASIRAKYSDFDSLLNPSGDNDPLTTNGLSDSNATISGELALYNQPVIITDSLLVNTTLISNSLNSSEGTLYLQPTASAPINLLAGLMTLTPDGKVNINGDLSVNGNIAAKTLRVSEGLTSNTATISGQLVLGKESSPSGKLFSLFNDQGDLVGAIDASGAASFQNLATSQVVTNGLIIAGAASESDTATSSASLSSNASIGTGIISAGATEITINNTAVKSGTYIYLTPISDSANQVLYLKSKQEGVGFAVSINQPLAADLKFNYWLIQTQP